VLLACSVQALYIFGTEKCPEFIEGQIKKTHYGSNFFAPPSFLAVILLFIHARSGLYSSMPLICTSLVVLDQGVLFEGLFITFFSTSVAQFVKIEPHGLTILDQLLIVPSFEKLGTIWVLLASFLEVE